ncbi:prolipoprotein diacylglyceryl transferase [Lachnoclostridium sp. MSJ-17]|uniref:prolipoprotein diacylglyceryl transferase n=1 Tax=Lachnoclostridium sp. MSJ-17 TaxID=2841516 RepID=UPI001C110ADB|nr:prolipoprotein diacylglyceryl transferase [Lachnoclostridium sp. MSJ-17]MBU5461384.1 prolipoprotein diacylglyceryl transferase [Lachnoclostridium sp. MSJ-17]
MESFHVQFPNLGWEFDINRVAIALGSFKVYWYGLIIATGLMLAILYAYKTAPRFQLNFSKLMNCVFVGLVTGIIGARLYFCIFKWDYYFTHPIEIFYIHEGGLAIYGGIIGALAGGLVVAKVQKMRFLPILDVVMIGFLIGQGLGRWGNFFNQEAYGTVTNLPWAMMSEGTLNQPVHPCFLYESLWCLLGALLLHLYSKYRQRYAGHIFFMYLVWYGFERMFVEGLRTDSLYLPFPIFGMDIRVSQVLSFAIFVTGIVILIINRHKEEPFYADYRRQKGIGRGKGKSQTADA